MNAGLLWSEVSFKSLSIKESKCSVKAITKTAEDLVTLCDGNPLTGDVPWLVAADCCALQLQVLYFQDWVQDMGPTMLKLDQAVGLNVVSISQARGTYGCTKLWEWIYLLFWGSRAFVLCNRVPGWPSFLFCYGPRANHQRVCMAAPGCKNTICRVLA